MEYTSQVDPSDRDKIRDWFSEGLESDRFLVAIKCLDEGIDIPACDSAILVSSSRSEREFVQRRGRVLRPYPSKKVAFIHDIVIVPFVKAEDVYPLLESELEFAKAELKRVAEFAKMAENGSEIDVSGLLKLYEGAYSKSQ
jgi:superfamily II DNA or RNA helicase